jgi:hypothetical protein
MKTIPLVTLLLLMTACTRPSPAPVAGVNPEIVRYQVVWNPGQGGGIPQLGAEKAVLVDTVTGRFGLGSNGATLRTRSGCS